jgi:tetratricopeptide (TPR) repeat protein
VGPGGDPRATSVDSKLQLQFRQKLADARGFMEKRDWTKAREVLQSTTDIFATHEDRDQMLAQVNEEVHSEQLLKKANQLFAQGGTLDNYEAAMGVYEQIKPSSDYYGEGRLKLDQVRVYLAEHALSEGLSNWESRKTDTRRKAAKAFCRYFTLLPEFRTVGTSEGKYREILVNLEKKLDKDKGYEPCQTKRFTAPTSVTPGSDAVSQADVLAELKKVHQLDSLVRVIELYVRGKLDEAIEQMRKLKELPSMQPQRVMLGGVFNKLSFIKGKFSEGNGFIQSENADAAAAAFELALAKDRELVPPTIESHVKKEAARVLAEEYLKQGDVEYGRSRYADAYALWHKGKLANPGHTGLLNALLKLEFIARNWVKEAEALAAAKKTEDARLKFEAVRKITEPGSRYYTEANKALSGGGGQ